MQAAPGTWRKWDGQDFTGEGIDGPSTVIPGLNGTWGSNPTVHWNTLLQRWVLIYASWPAKLYISTSRSGAPAVALCWTVIGKQSAFAQLKALKQCNNSLSRVQLLGHETASRKAYMQIQAQAL